MKPIRRSSNAALRIITSTLMVAFLSLNERAGAVQLDAVWVGGAGNWHVAGNWSPAAIPNNAADTYNVFIDDGDTGTSSVVTLNANASIDNLTIDASDGLSLPNARILTIVGGMNAGTVSNAGLLTLNSTGTPTDIRLNGGPVTLSGGGTLRLVGAIGSSNRIFGLGGASLINLDNTIRGAGQVGSAVTNITNAGLILADEIGGITIDPAASPFVNTGILRAANASVLRLTSGSFTNDGALIEALADSRVELNAVTLTGGTLSSSGSGFFLATGGVITLAQGLTSVVNLADLEANNGVDIRLLGSSFENAGSITLNSTGSATDLIADGSPISLIGGGEIILSNNVNNRLIGAGGGSLINADNTIRGAGQIGAATMNFTNQGTVIADQSNALTIHPSATVFNAGVLRAEAGGTLRLQTGTFENAGGLIEALDLSSVELSGVSINGGTLQSAGSGAMVATANSIFDGDSGPLILNTVLNMNNSVDIALRGAIENNSVINVNAAGSATDLQAADDLVTLSGGGVINLSNSAFARIVGSPGSSMINMDNTIRGSGNIGGGVLSLINHGDLIADQAVPMTITPGLSPFVNTGNLRATAGATLSLSSGTFDNTGGLIAVEDASLVTLSSATISGGELTATGSGLLRVTTAATFNGATNIPTNTGLIEFQNDADVVFLGAFNNAGRIHMASVATVTDFELHNGPVTLSGGGEVTMSNVAANRIFGVSGGSLINADNTISGSGSIGLAVTPITNQGTIRANQSVALVINPDGVIGIDNQGTLHSTNAATMTIGAAPFTTSGNVIVDQGATLSRTGVYTQTAGATIVNGALTATGPIQIQGGTLSGSGSITGSVTTGGITAPGTSAGQLNISGTYTQQPSCTLAIEIGGPTPGTQHDRLAVSGTATLDGAISISFINGYTPMIGQTFTVMTYPSRTGTFATIDIPCPANFGVAVNVLAASVQVQIVAPTSGLGDMNCDCAVSYDDVAPFALALIDPPAYATDYPICSVANADINQDTFSDGADIPGFIDLLLP